MELTESEKSIIDLIAKYAKSLNYPTTPRIVGGWVRDKIMGLVSDDMDVSVDNVSGFEFASGLVESLPTETPSIHKILANPEKSKHLETAVVRICGMDVDFVHLRDEAYSTTRIPVISRGTANSDAMRRDITINSLFYNVLTREIEDFSGRGVLDIKRGVIDTPLDPKVTLFDDPLRILRIFRFQAKFGFTIHKRIIEAIDDHRIREALKTKVSNERIWKELSKMLSYKWGNLGLIEITRNNYVDPIFKPAIDIQVKGVEEFIAKYNRSQYKCNDLIVSLYGILHNFATVKTKVNKKDIYVNTAILQDSLKAPKALVTAVAKVESNIEYLQSKYNRLNAELPSNTKEFVSIVLDCGENWLESLVICCFLHNNAMLDQIICKIYELNISHCNTIKNIVSGNDLIGLVDDFRELKLGLREILVHQIENPQLGKDELLKWYLGNKPVEQRLNRLFFNK